MIETPLELPGGGRALFTTRETGNLSHRMGPGARSAARTRERLRQRLGLHALAYSHQVHGARVRGVPASIAWEPPDSAPLEADGLRTAASGLGLLALSADCLPLALGTDGAVAMLHAGWRGLAAGVLEEGVHALRAAGAGEKIVAIIGPGAGPCCYEVGPEVHAALGASRQNGRRLDLKAIASERLLAAGVAEVRDLGLCTICDRRFFSHRREGARAGRQAGVAWRV